MSTQGNALKVVKGCPPSMPAAVALMRILVHSA